MNFEGREVRGLSKGRYDETFTGEDATNIDIVILTKKRKNKKEEKNYQTGTPATVGRLYSLLISGADFRN